MVEATVKRYTDNWIWTIVAAIGLAIAAYAIGNIIAFLVILFLRSIDVAVTGYHGRLALISAISLQAIGFGGFGLFYLKYTEYDRGLIRIQGAWLQGIGYIVGGIVTVLVGVTIVGFIISQLDVQPAKSQIITGFKNPVWLLVLIPVSIFIVGPAEELLFRGIVQGKIKHAIGPAGAIVIASAVFASIHVFGLLGTPIQMLITLSVIFVLSLILGSLYELSDNLVVPALVHGLYNAIQFYFAYSQAIR